MMRDEAVTAPRHLFMYVCKQSGRIMGVLTENNLASPKLTPCQ
jgi:hypothetical protein